MLMRSVGLPLLQVPIQASLAICCHFGEGDGGHTFIGALARKNVDLPVEAQISDNSSRSNNSPIGIPHPASNHSCKCHSNFVHGHTSKDLVSPATAAICEFHKNLRNSSEGSTPMLSGLCVL